MDKQQAADLLQRYQQGIATSAEQHLVELWHEQLMLGYDWYWATGEQQLTGVRILQRIMQEHPELAIQPAVRRIHFLRTGWFKYAAAIVIVFGLGTGVYFLTSTKNTEQTLANGDKRLQTDVAPGGNKAMLTLSDGTVITLDDAANGTIVQQGNAQVVKSASGQIVYNVKGVPAKEVVWNTMSTPIGGQYQITLPDGTKVWLNAASSITFPTTFVEEVRQVKVAGEVYFEVAKNKDRSFKVDVDGKSLVEVLGTSFNINSYADEGNITTTLLEGSLKVIATGTIRNHSNSEAGSAVTRSSDRQRSGAGVPASVILQPGQQASIGDTKGIVVKSDADLTQTLAWKDGLFAFNNADLPSVMRQLERWYNIQVKYEGNVPNIALMGEMYRNANLSSVLEFLKKSGLRFRMEGKTLVVL